MNIKVKNRTNQQKLKLEKINNLIKALNLKLNNIINPKQKEKVNEKNKLNMQEKRKDPE